MNRSRHYTRVSPLSVQSSLPSLPCRASDLLQGCYLLCLLTPHPSHLRPHLVHPAKPFVCIRLRVVPLSWCLRLEPYIVFPSGLSVLFSFSSHPSFCFCLASDLLCGMKPLHLCIIIDSYCFNSSPPASAAKLLESKTHGQWVRWKLAVSCVQANEYVQQQSSLDDWFGNYIYVRDSHSHCLNLLAHTPVHGIL